MAKLEKKIRSQALSNFTRNVNSLAPSVLVSPQFNKMKSCWDKLESAQESFIATTKIDNDTHQDGLAYLDEPGRKLVEVVSRYSEFLKQERESEKVERQKKVEEDSWLEEERRKRIALETKIAESQRVEDECKRRFDSGKAEFYIGRKCI